MSRDAVYFLAPTRGGAWRVQRVIEHGPYHDRRPATWRGPFASALDALRAADRAPEAPASPPADVRYIRCNGARILINDWTDRPTLCAEWGSEQCEGCGLDVIETGIVRGAVVVCASCGATYPIATEANPNDAESARRDRPSPWLGGRR